LVGGAGTFIGAIVDSSSIYTSLEEFVGISKIGKTKVTGNEI
jgi:hypothetical protein